MNQNSVEQPLARYFRKDLLNSRDVTVAGVINGSVLQMAGTICSPKDQFVKKSGREYAIERAANTPLITANIDGKSKKEIISLFVNLSVGIRTYILKYGVKKNQAVI